ncbi:MAG: hypothetical protein DHS20C15_32460 [Planctomycetota bacterium]|nr:MAG: hypothetical protein DHS20C15_32460 [Planctomycetota bacterium]
MTPPRDAADLRTLLVFPPQGHPTQPYLALPSLKAWLAEHGFPGATVWDLNLDTYEHFVSDERCALALERIQQRVAADPHWGADELSPEALDRYRLEADALAAGPYIATHANAAKRDLRDPDAFYDRPRYLAAMRVIEGALKLASTEYHPALFTAHNYTQSTSIDNTTDLFAGVDAEHENMFRDFFEEHALPRIERERPHVLGISVTYGSQLVPALTLATLVKQRFPEIHITLGGGMLAYVGQRLAHSAPLFDRVDSIAIYEGERPLLELCQAIVDANGAEPDLSAIHNLIHRRDGEVHCAGEMLPLPIDDLPTPDFGDLPLHEYFSGELVLPVAPTRGCYFEKCGFCTLYTAIGPTYRERSVERLVHDLQVLKERHGTPYFYFIMDDLPPLLAKRIPDAFAAAELEVYWWCDARMEERLFSPESCKALFDAGCRKLMFGFESGSQRVLDLVEKGTDLEEAERVLRNAHEAGISATLYTMVGLPTETREEADATRAFMVRNADWIGEISLQMFNLDMVSPMYRDPAKFGIAEIPDDPRKLGPGEQPRDDLARYLEHVSASGMTRGEVNEAFNSVLGAATEALAALRGDNFLYYRYKSHIFLYLCKFGRDVFRREHHAPRERTRLRRTAELPDRVSLRDDLHLAELPFPYAPVSDALDRAWTDPTPLGGVARTSSRARADAAPVPRRDSALAYVGQENRFLDLGADALRLLRAAASRGTQHARGLFGPEHQRTCERFLVRSYEEGLLRAVETAPELENSGSEAS